MDTDNDGTDNALDNDDDGDGVTDSADAFPLDSAESSDFDADGTGDNADTDDDNDGTPDASDAFPNDATETVDTDSDGVGDNSDAFASDPDEWVDADGDGTGDNADTDDDNDGTPDATDAFPLDAAETTDSDGDGTGDNGDAFPRDGSEWTDTDGDGTGNNSDTDDDNDGYTDDADSYPLDADRQRLFLFRLSGQHKESLFGDALAPAGDVDSDGRGDLLVGAPGARWSGYEDGRVHVVTGTNLEAADRTDGMRDGVVALDGVVAQPGHWALAGKRSDDRLGYDILAVGDIGGNGKQDWLIGASGRNNTMAAAYLVSFDDLIGLYPGGNRDRMPSIAEILSTEGAWELTAEGQGHDFAAGTGVSLIDDADGDGKPEFLIGTPRHSEDNDPDAAAPGAAYLVSSAHLASANAAGAGGGNRIELSDLRGKSGAWKFLGEADGDRAGASVASAGDIDGDGLTDLVVGAYGHTDSLDEQGAVYLIAAADLGAADRADGRADRVIRLANVRRQSASWKLVGEHENALAGYSVARSDLNGDGKAELVITAAGVSGGTAAVYVLPLSELSSADAADGSRNGIISLGRVALLENGWKMKGDDGTYSSAIVDWSRYELVAAPTATTGDFDGDGNRELLVGVPGHYRADSGSTAFLISGADLASADAADGQLDGELLFANIAAQKNSWRFVHGDFLTRVAAPGDLNADGMVDVAMTTVGNPWQDSYDSVWIASGAELDLADRQDGAPDGVIHLGDLPDWYRSVDFDLDGIEDALDADDDNDGVADTRDVFPKDPGESLDNDHDGIGNNADPDDDNDGAEDSADAFPFNPHETIDTDGDGIGNNADTDDDNDGVADDDDAFPLNFYESADSDGDGIGDNIDPDDDNDGIPDDEDSTPRGGTGYLDGIGGETARVPEPARGSDLFFYRLKGEASTLAGGDFDGDGLADLIIGSASDPKAAYLVSAAHLADADAADGSADYMVDMDRVPLLDNSWKITEIAGARRLLFAGDVDSDARDDVVVSPGKETLLMIMSSMNAADAADGVTDRSINLGSGLVGSPVGAWRLLGPALEPGVYSLADVNADGQDELLVGAPWTSDPAESNIAYVASVASGWMASGLEGGDDYVLDLDRLTGRPWFFKVMMPGGAGGAGSGASIASAGDVDGDGYVDLLVGAPAYSEAGSPAAQALRLLSGRHMPEMDGRDGVVDGVIRLPDASGAGLWRFVDGRFDMERAFSTAGDVDGDGLAEMLIAGSEGVFLIAGRDIAVADQADGARDQSIDIVNVVAQPGSYRFAAGGSAGSELRVLGVGDFDNDMLDDILVIPGDSSTAHLISARDLGALHAADDGLVDVANLPPLPSSWVLRIAAADTFLDGTASHGDLNGDGRPELVLGAHAPGGSASPSAYVISAAEFAVADPLDGAADRTVTLDFITARPIRE